MGHDEEVILLPDPERVMEGLRDTGYTFNTSSMADIIDNSIAASSSQIDITINMNPNLGLTIYVADNGIVMSEKGFLNVMKYGSDRRENLANLVKLGLWLKTSSTTFCHLIYVVYQG